MGNNKLPDADAAKEPDFQEEVVGHSLDAGRAVVSIGKTAILLYLTLPLLGLILGGLGGYFVLDFLGYAGGWKSWAGILFGMFTGFMSGFFAVPLIISTLVGDVVFDAGWKTAKSSWKAVRKK